MRPDIPHSLQKQEASPHAAAEQDPAEGSLQIAYSWMDSEIKSP